MTPAGARDGRLVPFQGRGDDAGNVTHGAPHVTSPDLHPATRKARRKEGGRIRAQRWRDRQAVRIAELQAAAQAAATLAADLDAVKARTASAEVDGALVAALVAEHTALRAATGTREPALPLVAVIRGARARLQETGMTEDEAREAIRTRLRPAVVPPATVIPGRAA